MGTKIHLGFTVIAFAALAAFISGCFNPAAGTTKNKANTGSISVSIPALAPWLQTYQTSASKNAAGTDLRAMARASSVKIEVYDSSSSPVMDPVTISVWTYDVGSSATETVDLIPVGTNYTVKASVYNSATSSTDPVVSGQTAGVDVTDGGSTPVSIHCVPVNPTAMTVDGAAQSVSLGSRAEKWYSVSITNGTHYYFSETDNNVVMGIFNNAGTFISTNGGYIDYVATYSGTLYVCVVAGNNSGTANLTVTSTAPVLSEGSQAAPVALTPNSAHVFKAGPAGTQDTSYYSFTTTTLGSYAIATDAGYYYATLYADSGFSTVVVPSTFTNVGVVFSGLSAATTYYMTLRNETSSGSMSLSGQIADPSVTGAMDTWEGSAANPESLTLGTSWEGKAGNRCYSISSYYQFTTGTGTDYRIVAAPHTPPYASAWTYVYVYSDSSFTNSVGSFEFYNDSVFTDLILTPSSTYYVKITNGAGNGAITYTLTASAYAPTYNALPANGTWTTGSLATTGESVWYEATVVAGQTYLLNWDSYGGSGSYTLDASVTGYQQDRATTYFAGANIGFTTVNAQLITIPAGQTKIYVRVASLYGEYKGTFALKLAVKPPTGSLAVTID